MAGATAATLQISSPRPGWAVGAEPVLSVGSTALGTGGGVSSKREKSVPVLNTPRVGGKTGKDSQKYDQ